MAPEFPKYHGFTPKTKVKIKKDGNYWVVKEVKKTVFHSDRELVDYLLAQDYDDIEKDLPFN